MRIRLKPLLGKLAEFQKRPAPGLLEISKESGVERQVLHLILSNPRVSVKSEHLEGILSYLFAGFRPCIDESVSDQALMNRLMFELFEYEFDSPPPKQLCTFEQKEKFSLQDLTP